MQQSAVPLGPGSSDKLLHEVESSSEKYKKMVYELINKQISTDVWSQNFEMKIQKKLVGKRRNSIHFIYYMIETVVRNVKHRNDG